MRSIALFAACAVASLALAQNANEQARQLAKRLGSERSVEGLQTLVDSRNKELLEWYERGWRDTSLKEKGVPAPPAIEAIIVKNYRDPVVGAPLRTLVSANWTPYQTRALFDLMFEEWRSGKERPTTYPIREGIFNTNVAGIEPPVLAWLNETPGPGEYDANNIMRFLSKRKYAPAVPAIAKRLRAADTGKGLMYVDWLLPFGTREATAAVVERLGAIRERSGGVDERVFIADRLASLPEGALDLDAFRAALGPGIANDPRYRSVNALLADPKQYYAQRAGFTRNGELARKQMELRTKMAEAFRDRDAQPQRYADALQAHVNGLTVLASEYRDLPAVRGVNDEIANTWINLGNFTRFRLRDPRRALEQYASAERAGNGVAIFLQADTWQFSLRDKARAIAEYRRNLEKLGAMAPATNRDEAAFIEWARRWLRHQVAYLEKGTTFSGAIGRDDAAGVGLFVFLGTAAANPQDDPAGLLPLYEKLWNPGRGAIDKAEVARQLDALPASNWLLMRTAGLIAHLPDARSVLAYLARNDPAGYASASYFGLMDQMERGPPEMREGHMGRAAIEMFGDMNVMREARARFVREHRVTFTP